MPGIWSKMSQLLIMEIQGTERAAPLTFDSDECFASRLLLWDKYGNDEPSGSRLRMTLSGTCGRKPATLVRRSVGP